VQLPRGLSFEYGHLGEVSDELPRLFIGMELLRRFAIYWVVFSPLSVYFMMLLVLYSREQLEAVMRPRVSASFTIPQSSIIDHEVQVSSGEWSPWSLKVCTAEFSTQS
jgi:hypothetical protein